MPRRHEQGYILAAAVAALALFGGLAFMLMAANRGDIASLQAEQDRARLTAAVRAGMALAIHGVATADRSRRWPIDGLPRQASFQGIGLTITIEDNSGKIGLNRPEPKVFRNLVAAAGVDGERLNRLERAYSAWVTEGGGGTDAVAPLRPGDEPIQRRRGQFWSLGELMRLNGMDRALYDRIAPALTIFPGNLSGLNRAHAQPLALAAVAGSNSPEVLQRQRELNGQRVAQDIAEAADMSQRPITIMVEATLPGDARMRQAMIIEFAGAAMRRYEVRALN